MVRRIAIIALLAGLAFGVGQLHGGGQGGVLGGGRLARLCTGDLGLAPGRGAAAQAAAYGGTRAAA